MPGWAIHTIVANKISDKININKNNFIFGNIVPDINNGYLVEDISKKISHMDTHFTKEEDIQEKKFNFKNIERFKEEYKNKMDNPIVLGCFTHLLTDSFWNQIAFDEHYVYGNAKEFEGIKLHSGDFVKCEKREATAMKQREFKEFGSRLLKQNANILFPNYNEDIISEAKEIVEFNITRNDVMNVIEYLNDVTKNQQIEEDFEFVVFSEQELQKRFEDTIEYCLREIDTVDKFNIIKR